MKQIYFAIQGAVAAFIAWLSAKLGRSSRRGAEGIIKKVGYLCVIAVAMVVDYLILRVSAETGFEVSAKAFFGLLVAIWYILNEILSIIENAGRMGSPVPEWLMRYVSVLKNKIDSQGDGTEERVR